MQSAWVGLLTLILGTAFAQANPEVEVCNVMDQLRIEPTLELLPRVVVADTELIYSITTGGRLMVIDPASLRIVSDTTLDNVNPSSVTIHDGYLYALSVSSPLRLVTIDVRDPTSPILTSSLPLSQQAELAWTDHSLVLMSRATSSPQTVFVDTVDPASPSVSATAVPFGRTLAAASRGNFIFASLGGSLGFVVYESSEPGVLLPRQTFLPLSTTGVRLTVSAMERVGDRLYISVTGPEPGVWILDISRPTVPVLMGTILQGVSVNAICFSEGRLFINTTGTNGGIRVFETADPDAPTQIADLRGLMQTDRFGVGGPLVVGASSAQQLLVLGLDICDTCRPDLAAPFGQLDFFDVGSFVNAYAAMQDSADLAAPFGVWDFFDVATFISLFNAGCTESDE